MFHVKRFMQDVTADGYCFKVNLLFRISLLKAKLSLLAEVGVGVEVELPLVWWDWFSCPCELNEIVNWLIIHIVLIVI